MKRFLYILSILLGSLLLLMGVGLAVLRSSDVQTASVRLLTNALSNTLGAEASIGHVQFRLPAHLELGDILIRDQAQDTMVYVRRADVRFHPLALRRGIVRFSRADIEGVRANAHHITDSTFNFTFFLEAFKSDTSRQTALLTPLHIEDIRLNDWQLRYDDYRLRVPAVQLSLDHLTIDPKQAHPLTLRATMQKGCCTLERDSLALDVEQIATSLALDSASMQLAELEVKLPQSKLSLKDISISQEQIHLDIHEAEIVPHDLALVAPAIAQIDRPISASGHLSGRLDSLTADGLSLAYNHNTLLQADATLIGLPRTDSLYVRARIQDITATAAIVQDFLSDFNNRPFTLPKVVHTLGRVHYRGQIQGRLDSLGLHGSFSTAVGSISTTAQLRQIEQNRHLSATVSTSRLALGRLLGQSDLGDVAMSLSTKATSVDGAFPTGTLHAHVDNITYRAYTYHDLCLHGDFARTRYNGLVSLSDDNLQFTFTGLADRTHGADYNFDLRIDKLLPQQLHLIEKDVELSLSSHVNLSGFNPDLLSGYLVIDSLQLRNEQDSLFMKQLSIIADHDTLQKNGQGKHTLCIQSDYLKGDLKGDFAYTTLHQSILRQLVKYVPSIFSHKRQEQILAYHPQNKLHLSMNGTQMQKLQEVLHLPFRLDNHPILDITLDDKTNQCCLQAFVNRMHIRNKHLDDVSFSLFSTDGLRVSLSAIMPADTLTIKPNGSRANPVPIYLPLTLISFVNELEDDTLVTTLNLDHMSDDRTTILEKKQALHVATTFSRYAGLPFIESHILPSELSFSALHFGISDSRITYSVADTLLTVSHFRAGFDDQFIAIDGMGSTHSEDSLHIYLNHINPEPLMPFVLPEQVLTVGGDLSGWARVYGLFSKPIFDAEALLKDARLCGQPIGDAHAVLALDRANQSILIDGVLSGEDDMPYTQVDGLIRPRLRRWDLDIHTDSIPLGFINHWTSSFLTNIGGSGSGHVHVGGHEGDVYVTAAILAHDARLTIPFTGCEYTFNDSVYMDSTSIRFPNLTALDALGNPLTIDGEVTHTSFENFHLDISVHSNHALVFDLPYVEGDMMSGRVFINGGGRIYGSEKDIRLEAAASSRPGSSFMLSIDGASSAHDNTFVRFVDHSAPTDAASATKSKDEEPAAKPTPVSTATPDSRFLLSMEIDATPDVLFELMLDSRTGDVIRARGEGGLRLIYETPSENISLVGTYTLQSGSLSFTVGNAIRRDFTILEGSQLIWSGNPETPTLDVTASYTVNASLRDLFGDEISNISSSRASVPVSCLIHLSGGLYTPIIRFSLDLPMSEEAVRTQMRAVINTDEMLMRQVIYLLAFGRFYTPEYMQNTTAQGVNEMYSLLSSTITGQINSWLGKLTNVFTMGVNIRTEGEGADASQEYEAQFQLQPVDRLVINGNLGYRYNDISNRPFFGDVDIEYMLTPNGKLRAKAYTHTVDKYSLRQASTIQGVGLVVRHDFNWPEIQRDTTKTRKTTTTTSTSTTTSTKTGTKKNDD